VDDQLALANAYFMAQRPQDALREAEAVLKVDPAQAFALKLKSSVEYLSGDRDNALSAFVTLLDHHPEDEEGFYMLERIYYEEARIDHAIGQLQHVLRINPKSYKAFDNLGLCY
jgi:tetratricopeptide (TPR) repeat protein